MNLQSTIEQAFEARAQLTPDSVPEPVRDAVQEALQGLNEGRLRVAEPTEVGWVVNEWLKKAVLLSFCITDNEIIDGGHTRYRDKVAGRFALGSDEELDGGGVRIVPPATARFGSYVAPGVVLMPSFVNIGAYVDSGTMVDTWATVGSCAQIGKDCHISGGAGIGGVLEPLQAEPVIIEDNCFIGARAEVAEGVRVEEGSVLSMGVYLGASTKIVDRATGEIHQGRVPAYSVVVSGSLPGKALPDGSPGPSLYCAVIVKRVDQRTRAETSINELLRD